MNFARTNTVLRWRRRTEPGSGTQRMLNLLAFSVKKTQRVKSLLASPSSWLELAAKSGARLAINPDFAVMLDEQALLAQAHLLPASPATFSLLEAAFYAAKLPQEHNLPRCIMNLSGILASNLTSTGYAASGLAATRFGLDDAGSVDSSPAWTESSNLWLLDGSAASRGDGRAASRGNGSTAKTRRRERGEPRRRE